jgi:rhamnosyltransferase subunit B
LNCLLVCVGSSGDVHPFVGLGLALLRRGHRVTLVTNRYFENLARQAGLDFFDPCPQLDFRQMIDDPQVWHWRRGVGLVLRKAVLPLVRPTYEAIASRFVPGETMVIGSSLALGTRIAQDKLGIPTATIHLSPALFRTDYEGPAGAYLGARVPKWLKRLQYTLADRLVIDPILAPAVNGLRAELGLSPVRRLMADWWNSPQLVLGMFPDWFGLPQPDWPSQTRLMGFPLYDERGLIEPPAEVRDFLDQGSPPIVFTPGSAMVHGHEFFDEAVKACELLGRRGILLTRFAEQLPPKLPPTVRHFDFVPFSTLLPRAAAVVHHGGIGSTSQGLAAGIPQLIMPMGFDQFDNAARLARLGVGGSLLRHHFRARELAAELSRLVDSPRVRENCRTIKAKFAGCDALADTVIALEELAGRSR